MKICCMLGWAAAVAADGGWPPPGGLAAGGAPPAGGVPPLPGGGASAMAAGRRTLGARNQGVGALLRGLEQNERWPSCVVSGTCRAAGGGGGRRRQGGWVGGRGRGATLGADHNAIAPGGISHAGGAGALEHGVAQKRAGQRGARRSRLVFNRFQWHSRRGRIAQRAGGKGRRQSSVRGALDRLFGDRAQ